MTFCSQCGKWAGANAILPGAATVGLCFCPPIVPTSKRTWVGLTDEAYMDLAHRIASKYTHRTDPTFTAYTFLPHTLEQFVRSIEDELKEKNT